MTQKITVAAKTGEDGSRQVTVGARIVELIEAHGMTPSLAGRDCGVDADTVWKWIKEGREAVERRGRGVPLYAAEQRKAEFVGECDRARARYVRSQLELMDSLAAGGVVVAEIVEEVDPTETEIDPKTGDLRPRVLKRRMKQTRTLPSETAIRFNLERKAGDEGFGPPARQLEVSGPDGGAIPVDVDAKARSLLEEAKAYAQGVADGRAREQEVTG